MRLRTLLWFAIATALVWEGTAEAKGRSKLVGAKLVNTIKPPRGFVDDPFAFDGAGGRLVYVNADAARLAELRVIDLTQNGAQLAAIDISGFTTTPTRVEFVLDGDHFFVVSRPAKDQPAVAALIDNKGKVVRRFGPADDIVLTEDRGQPIVVSYTETSVAPAKKHHKKRGKKGADKGGKAEPSIEHTVSAVTLDRGKVVVKKRSLVTDASGYDADLDFRISYWADNYLRVVGVEGGSWDAKEDQRSPDREAWYDMRTGTISKRIEISNLIRFTQRLALLAEHDNQPQFLVVAADLSGLRLEGENVSDAIKLAEPFHHYKPGSLQWHPSVDGGFFFTLTIDPVNPDAVARKRAVPEYMDLYELAPGAKKAVRRARLLLKGKRKYRWQATPDNWIVVPLHIGFDRGGKQLQIYALTGRSGR